MSSSVAWKRKKRTKRQKSNGTRTRHLLLKALANEDTLLRTHCCRHKCFPVCPCAQHLLRTQILCPGHKNVSDFVQKHFVSATNVSHFAQPKKHHGQQCDRNNVSSFARGFKVARSDFWVTIPFNFERLKLSPPLSIQQKNQRLLAC